MKYTTILFFTVGGLFIVSTWYHTSWDTLLSYPIKRIRTTWWTGWKLDKYIHDAQIQTFREWFHPPVFWTGPCWHEALVKVRVLWRVLSQVLLEVDSFHGLWRGSLAPLLANGHYCPILTVFLTFTGKVTIMLNLQLLFNWWFLLGESCIYISVCSLI